MTSKAGECGFRLGGTGICCYHAQHGETHKCQAQSLIALSVAVCMGTNHAKMKYPELCTQSDPFNPFESGTM